MIFALQKRTVRIIAGVKSRNSCRNLFLKLQILPFPCEYIFTLINSVVNYQEHFQANLTIHSVNTKNRDHLHRLTADHSCFQKVHTMLASNSSTIYHFMNKKA
jgi:IS1 family transposase